MKIMMYLENDFIDALPICPQSVSLPGYIGKMKKQLEEKYISLIKRAGIEPEFLVVPVSQKENPST